MKNTKDNELEFLSKNQQQRFIIRNNKADKKHCVLFICFSLEKPGDQEHNMTKKQDMENTSYFYIEKYHLIRKFLNTSLFAEPYKFQIDKQYFKIYQAYYEKTIFSLDYSSISYDEKLDIITNLATIVSVLNKQLIVIRSLCPQIVSCSLKNQEVQLIWLDEAIQLVYEDQLISKSCKVGKQIREYLAPEIRLRKPHGLKADVWSLGAIFYEILFGKQKCLRTKGQVSFPQNTPQWLQNILKNMLDQDPNRRCSISTCLSYLKSMKCCSEVSGKIIPFNNKHG